MNEMTMAKFGVGARTLRLEDKAFITGHGEYTDDVRPDGALAVAFLRSPIAAGTFKINDASGAKSAPGVHLVLTHEDVANMKPLPSRAAAMLPNADGTPTAVPPHPVLADGRVHHVGVPIAMVVAETQAQANDAIELIEVDWDSEPAVTDTATALDDNAPLVWPDHGSNLAFLYAQGNEAETNAAFDKAAKTVKLTLLNNRLVSM
ncbi:MAG: hypothetical protein AAFW98_01750 [Pseudomonadota bacterium]